MTTSEQNDPTGARTIPFPAEDEIRAALSVAAAAVGAPAPGEGRSLPSIAIAMPLAALSHAVAQCLRSAPIFRRGDDLVTVNPDNGDLQPMTSTRFRSWHQRFFSLQKMEDGDRKIVNVPEKMARAILASDELRDDLREIRTVATLRLPVWRGEGSERTIGLLPEGYDATTKTYTVPRLDYETDWPLEDAHAWLESTFGTFPFFEKGDLFARRSFSAHVAGMVGVFTSNLLAPGAVRPMVVANGNQPGLGKTLLVHAQLSPVHGEIEDDSKPKDDGEMRSVLAAASLAGAPYIVLDDAANLHSHDLNKFITSPVHVPRVLGVSKRVRCPNLTQVFATGNALSLTSDLDRRSLVVDLFDPGKATDRPVRNPLTTEFVFSPDYRRAACGALWALVRHWNEAGRPVCRDARKPSFEAYAALVGSLVVACGFANPFTARECSSGGDEASRALERCIAALAGDAILGDSLSTDEVLGALREADTLDLVVPYAKNDLGQRQAVGHKLRKLRGRELTDSRGRRFEFGKRDSAPGARYTLHFLDDEAD